MQCLAFFAPRIAKDPKETKGVYSQISMDILYQRGGIKGKENGGLSMSSIRGRYTLTPIDELSAKDLLMAEIRRTGEDSALVSNSR